MTCADLSAAPHTQWGLKQTATGWSFVTPCGETFRSIGVNVVDGGSPWRRDAGRVAYHWPSFYPSHAAWAAAARTRLLDWGFNTAGGWSTTPELLRLPVTPVLELGHSVQFVWVDPFAAEAETTMAALARIAVAPYRHSPYRIGYFTDNEIGWWNGSLFLVFSAYPATNMTKQRLVALLRGRYAEDWAAFEQDFVVPPGVRGFVDLLGSRQPPRLRPGGAGIGAVRAWTRVFAERYYRVARHAIRSADPHALVLGDRLPIYYDPDAVRAMSPHVDVVSVNYNVDAGDGWVGRYFFDALRELTGGKPVLVSEVFFAAHENRSGNLNRTGPPRRANAPISHNRNRTGHLATVPTQTERAAGAAAAIHHLLARTDIVGVHWFQYYDHPRGGRDDGEDYNFGLVDIHDRPYQRLTAALAAAHRTATRDDRLSPAKSGPVGSSAALHVPRGDIDPEDGSLREWPKAASLMPMRADIGEVVFGDVHVAWNEDGLYLAVNAMDYYDPDLLAFDGNFPLGEAFRVAVGADAGGGPRIHVFHVVPEDRGRSITGERKLTFRVAGCSAQTEPGAAPRCRVPASPGVVGHYFGVAMDQPRVMAEMFLPWEALGVAAAPPDRRTRLEVSLTAFFRSRSMSMGGRSPDIAFEDSRRWRVVQLGE